MRSCWLGALLVAVTFPVPTSAAAAAPPAVVASPTAAARRTTTTTGPVLVARYGFNGRSSTIVDESGNGHTLSIVSAHGGAVRSVVHASGLALAFPAGCLARVCPHVALQSPSQADLNPGVRDFAYGADVLLAANQTSKGENIVQKGYSARGNQWKLQVDGTAGRPSCVLVDRQRPAIRIARSPVSIADGRWHALRCRRGAGLLTISIDGVDRGSTRVPNRLSIVNDDPLSIGAKGAFADNDQFNGALDNVWMQIG